jgi:triosephosphate isomerase (TIM)
VIRLKKNTEYGIRITDYDLMTRTPIIAGNWKMHMTLEDAKDLVLGIHHTLKFPGNVDVVVAPPFTALASVVDTLKESYIDVAAQNLHEKDHGAYTGEVSGNFVKNAGANYVIIGHSERRQYFHETNELIGQKITAALRNDLIPILCIGETLEERSANEHFAVTEKQVTEALKDFSELELENMVIAYEPVWAIGTGEVATIEQIDEIHKHIRTVLGEMFSGSFADKVRIQYGGSVKPSNAKEILSLEHVDGALVGGAALKAMDFIEIIKAAKAD